MKLLVLLIAGLAFAISPIAAQWLVYPTPNVPRTLDGEPNLSAPTPRTADGKPDLSGLWEPELNGRIGEGTIAIAPGDDPVTPEFINIGSRLEGGLPYQPWAAQLAKKRTREELGAHDPLGNGFPVGLVRLHSYATPRISRQRIRHRPWKSSRRQNCQPISSGPFFVRMPRSCFPA
jgi:hypothetical protein